MPSIYSRPELYEAAFSFRDIPAEVDVVARWLGGVPTSILELAAGPAAHAIELARRGSAATAVDVSPAMVRHAARRADEVGVALDARVGDMSDFALVRRFGAVLTMAGAIGHLTDETALKAHFRCVARHLAPGGRYVLETSKPGDGATRDRWRLTRGGIRFDVRFSPRLLTVRVRGRDGRTQTYRDVLGLRPWTAGELTAAAEGADLRICERHHRLAGQSRLVLVFGRQSSSMDSSS